MLLRRQAPPPVELLAAPVLEGARYRDEPIYFSDVVVAADSDVRGGFAALRGRSWAYNDLLSHSGYNVTRFELIRRGETAGFFGSVVEAGSHHRAMEMVAAGEVDGAAIDSQVLEVESVARPALRDELRVIDALGPSTIQPVVVAAALPPDLKARLRQTITTLHADPGTRRGMSQGLFLRFVPVPDERYDDIRRMVSAAEESGYLSIR